MSDCASSLSTKIVMNVSDSTPLVECSRDKIANCGAIIRMEECSAVNAFEAECGDEMISGVRNASAENISTTTFALERQISIYSSNMPMRALKEGRNNVEGNKK